MQREKPAGAGPATPQRPLWLVRGQDRAGNDFEVGHTQ